MARKEQIRNIVDTALIQGAFDKIKMNIDFTTLDTAVKSLVVTSSTMGEGKTTTAINTAISMAAGGGRTLLVDADMRQPRIHKLFNMANLYGLSDAIVGTKNWQDLVADVGIHNLGVISSGRKPPNPAELFGSQKMASIIGSLKEYYDYIVFDTPPILPVPDALSLSKLTDGIILVVRYGYATSKLLQECRDALKIANANVIGAVINDVPSAESAFRYGTKYGYGYGPGGGKEARKLIIR